MKRIRFLCATIICIILFNACTPAATSAPATEEPATSTPTLAPTPTATAIPAKLMTLLSNDTGAWQLYSIHSDGSAMTRVTSNEMIEGTYDYSPDGQRIAFETYLEDEGNSEIYVMQADGSGVTRLTHRSQNDWGPVWSPDGSKLLFLSNLGDTNYEIFVMNADGSRIIDLSNNSGLDSFPVWSPDGTRIAYSAGGFLKADDVYSGKNNSAIYVINADGSGKYKLSTLDGADIVSYPQWSPDGSQILFGCGGVINNTSGDTIDLVHQQGVCLASADGSNVVQLYSAAVDIDAYGVNYRAYAVWSHDGSTILFVGSEADGTTQIYTMNPDGSNLVKLTSTSEEMKCLPAWSKDDTMISYLAQTGSLLNRRFTGYTMFADGSSNTYLAGPYPGQLHINWME